MKKILAVILVVVLLFLAGGNFYYTCALREQNDDLYAGLNDMVALQQERIALLEEEVDAFEEQSGERFDALLDSIQAITAALGELADQLDEVQDTAAIIAARVSDVEERLAAVEETAARETGIDAAAVYDAVVATTVRITDGDVMYGSGFIYSVDGKVITAYHVVEGLSPIYVMMYDGRVSRAALLGFSEISDVAVLRLVDNPGITPAPLADSDSVPVGAPVVAIGSPGDTDAVLGLRDTLTAGVISQKDRLVTIEDNSIANLLQFDAPINFGNSGCALFGADGSIVGLVIARVDAAVGDGIYWAVASNKVGKVAEEIIETGSFAHPWIGVSILDLSPLTVEEMGLSTANGVLVTSVFSGSPAQTAGFRVNDVIIALGGQAVRNTDELVSFLAEKYSPDDSIAVTVIRNGLQTTLAVTLGER